MREVNIKMQNGITYKGVLEKFDKESGLITLTEVEEHIGDYGSPKTNKHVKAYVNFRFVTAMYELEK
jgi:small nuclear ribonucleoprotein (snRNP)-like protein